jgi:acyl-CoA hydrolase
MFSDGIIPLIESGVITNQHKTKHKGYVVTGFMMGSSNLYAYVNDNPLIRVLDIMYVNDTAVIRQLPKVTAINSAIEVDLTGQVCADLFGKSIQDRARALIQIAHPSFREELEKAAREIWHLK